MKWYLPFLLVLSPLFTGCSLLGISGEEAAAEASKLKRGVEGLQQMLDNAAKMDGVRKEVAAVSIEILNEATLVSESLAKITEFLTPDPNAPPTQQDYLNTVAEVEKANAAARRLSIMTESIDAKFGKTELPPDLQAELLRLRDSGARLIERIETTAARVKKVTDVIVKVGNVGLGLVGGAATGGGSTVASVISAIIVGAAGLGATADAVAKKKANGGTAT